MSSQSALSIASPATWTRALLWKEFRQVMPLMLTVLGLGFGLLLIILISAAFSSQRSFKYEDGFWFLFLSMPMMYATGVGILLVGTEKESRSMQWMRSLPVCGKQIAWNKLVVALVTLGLVWLIALSTWAIFAASLGAPLTVVGSLYKSGSDASSWLLVDYMMVSLFLCLAGLAFAWRFESQIVSLVMLIPAALAIWLPAYGISEWFELKSSSMWFQRAIDSWIYVLGLTVGCIAALVYGWRASQRELSALAAPAQENSAWGWAPAIFGSAFAQGATSEARSAEAWSLWPSVTPLSGMLWQMIRQNGKWWSLIGMISLAALVSGSFCDIRGNSEPVDGDWVFWVLFPMALLSGLLGVLAFQSDGIQQRVRFYADRGVSPSGLWLTRHWIPVTIVLFFGLIRYLSLRLSQSTPMHLILVDTAAVLAVCLAAYIVGQWVSQFIKSPILSAIVLPAVLLTSLVYCGFAVLAMESPWWLLIFSFLIIAVSTWWMMRPWMERRIDWKYYLQHGGFVLAAVAVPLAPGLWKIWNLPKMSSELRGKLEQLSLRNPGASYLRPSRISSPYLSTLSGGAVGSSVLAHNEEVREYQRNQIIAQTADSSFWLEASDPQELLKIYVAELASLQSSLMSKGDVSASDAQESLRRYREAMASVPKVVAGLRATKRLRICDISERIELTALGHCRHTKAREWMGDAAYQSNLKLLGDDQARDQSRRVALAFAWWESSRSFDIRRPQLAYSLDGYPIQYLNNDASGVQPESIPSSIAVLRSRDLYVADLWRLLELPLGSDQAAEHRRLIDSKNAYSSRSVADGEFVAIDDYPVLSPGETWRGGWEVLAKKLIAEGGNRE